MDCRIALRLGVALLCLGESLRWRYTQGENPVLPVTDMAGFHGRVQVDEVLQSAVNLR